MINFVPHTVDSGIVFRRIDLDPPVDLPADAMLIQEAFMCSNLIREDIRVGTIEHVMSAIAALGMILRKETIFSSLFSMVIMV